MAVAFGTDGIRGAANVELTAEVALSLGRAACGVLGTGTWLIGADTRASGPMLVAALAAGLASAGADVVDLGVLPTPGVAFHAQARGCPAAVVSASHNAWTDNGIKLLATGGRKLTDALEHAIAVNLTAPDRRPSSAVGRIARAADPVRPYVEHLVAALEGRRLDGMRVVLDCANGAASAVAPAAFRAAGADVIVVAAEPDGPTSTPGAARPTRPGCRTRWWSPGPMPGWPSTVTPTGSWPWPGTARSSTATGSSPSARPTCTAGVASPGAPSCSR